MYDGGGGGKVRGCTVFQSVCAAAARANAGTRGENQEEQGPGGVWKGSEERWMGAGFLSCCTPRMAEEMRQPSSCVDVHVPYVVGRERPTPVSET